MRALVRRLLGPPFEAVMRRLEATIEAGDHLEAAEAILRDGSMTNISAALVACCRHELAPEAESESPACDRSDAARELAGLLPVAFGAGRFERESEVHLGSLLPPVPDAPASLEPIALPEGASWSGEPGAVAAAREASVRLLTAARIGAPADRLREPLFRLAGTLEPARWLLRKGTPYGGSALLRALIRLEALGAGEPAPGFTRGLCDRLLRHVEVRREQALAFLPESAPDDARPARERLRFAVALLEAAEQYGDVRYLNTALKLADWHLAKARPGEDLVTDLHYAALVARQERLMRELLP